MSSLIQRVQAATTEMSNPNKHGLFLKAAQLISFHTSALQQWQRELCCTTLGFTPNSRGGRGMGKPWISCTRWFPNCCWALGDGGVYERALCSTCAPYLRSVGAAPPPACDSHGASR